MRVLVVGPHRCGTSAVAGTIEALGVNFGMPEAGWPTYPSNPKGQFEYPPLVTALDYLVGPWRFPRTHLHIDDAVERLLDVVQGVSEPAGFKDPRLCFVAQYCLPVVTHIVAVARDLGSAAASLTAREPNIFMMDIAHHLLATYQLGMVNVVQAAHNRVPVHVVEYRKLCQGPDETVTELAEFLDLPVTDAALAFPDPTLRHYQ